MKTAIVAVNSQYIHSNYAVYNLLAVTPDAKVFEFNINGDEDIALQELFKFNPDVIAFSCYIWNINYITSLSYSLKIIMPNCKIALGGPEVSFRAKSILEEHPFFDCVMCGEGEEMFPNLIEHYKSGISPEIDGVTYRDNSEIRGNDKFQIVEDMTALPDPYNNFKDIPDGHRITYYESSRGCPFSCAYCLSAAMGNGVRYLPLETVYKHLKAFYDHGTPLLKFIDRTFNANKERAKSIIKYAIANTGEMRIHFEVGADLLDDELTELLTTAPKGKFQIEAGVQSCNEKTLKSVVRTASFEKIKKNVVKIIAGGNTHVHLDLIAGLPYENIDSFKNSFNMVYNLHPHDLQLGFLKVLYGSPLYKQKDQFKISYRQTAPYEVLKTPALSPDDIFILKRVEEVLERYYNSERCDFSLHIAQSKFETPYDFYFALSEYCNEKGFLSRPISAPRQLQILADFIMKYLTPEEQITFLSLLKLDYLSIGGKGEEPTQFSIIDPPLNKKIVEYKSELKRAGQISQDELKKCKFTFLPINPFSLLKEDTLIMVNSKKRDVVTGMCEVKTFDYKVIDISL